MRTGGVGEKGRAPRGGKQGRVARGGKEGHGSIAHLEGIREVHEERMVKRSHEILLEMDLLAPGRGQAPATRCSLVDEAGEIFVREGEPLDQESVCGKRNAAGNALQQRKRARE